MSLKRKHPSPPPLSSSDPTSSDPSPSNSIFTSEPLHDRQSIFQAYFSPTLSPSTLQSHPDLASASHRILAARLPSSKQKTLSGTPLLTTTTDDDGEKYGAKRASSVLEAEKVTGTLVIGRWYGGVMLGPVRFTHMETVGREAVAAWRTWEAGQRAEERKVLAEGAERGRLVRELRERDESVIVLRGLLEVKTGGPKAEVSAKKVVMDYEGMELGRLRNLDKARDSTIAFLLKQIDAAEKGSASSSQAKREEKARRTESKQVEGAQKVHTASSRDQIGKPAIEPELDEATPSNDDEVGATSNEVRREVQKQVTNEARLHDDIPSDNDKDQG